MLLNMSNGPIVQQKNKSAFKLKQENKAPIKPYGHNKAVLEGGLPQNKNKAPFDLGKQENNQPIKHYADNAPKAKSSTLFFTE